MNNSKTVNKLYKGLLQDRYRLNDVNHTFSDGYDLAQTAICFLCGHIGKTLGDNAGTENNGSAVTIERACYRAVSRCINREHRTSLRTVCLDDWNGLETAAPSEREMVEQNYSAVDEKIKQLKLTTRQREILSYRMNAKTLDEIGRIFSLTRSAICYRMITIRKRYIKYFGSL